MSSEQNDGLAVEAIFAEPFAASCKGTENN